MVKIFIGNLSDDADNAELRTLFEKFGTVTECDILRNFGFVHMEGEDEAQAAIAALHGYMFYGSKMNVEISHGRGGPGRGGGRGGRGGGGDRGGYRHDMGPRGRGGYGGWGRGGRRDRDDGYGPDRGGRGDYGGSRYDPYDRLGRLSALDRLALEDFLFERRIARLRSLPPSLSRELLSGSGTGGMGGRDPYARPPPEYYSASRSSLGDRYGELGAAASADMYDLGAGRRMPGGAPRRPYIDPY